VEEKRKTEIKSNIREIEKYKQPHYYRSTGLVNAEKEVNKSIYHQETSEDSENECCECWENSM